MNREKIKQVVARGRPLISQKGNQRRRNITIDDCTYKIIKVIGNGNFSQGVRKLYDQHSIIRNKEEKISRLTKVTKHKSKVGFSCES